MSKKSDTKKVDFKETLWKSAEKLRNQMDAAEYKHIVLGLIFLKYISDSFDIQKNKIKKTVSDPKSDLFISENPEVYGKELEDRDYYTKDNIFWVPQNARWEKIRSLAKQAEIGSIIDKAMVEIENENKSLIGKLDKRFGRTQLEEGKLGELIDLISKIGFEDNSTSKDLLGEVYEYFLGKFAAAEGKRGGQFYTTRTIVKTLVSILEPYNGRVYDPCCGSGGMFVQSEEFVKSHGGKVDDISIYGQESNPTTWRLASMNMALRGYAADLGNSHGSSFGNDQHQDKKFDFILANPPFNDQDWEGEKYREDVRWVYGTPPVNNANFAWFQHIIWKLKPDGQAGIVMSNGASSAEESGEGEIRRAMIKDDLIEVMITLPPQLFINVQVPATLWFLTKNKNKHGRSRQKEHLFINAKNLGTMINSTQKEFTDEDINFLSNTVKSWRLGKDYRDIKGLCKSVTIKEIVENNYNLAPARYVGIDENQIEKKFSDDDIELSINDLLSFDNESKKTSEDIFSALKQIKFKK
tara:strand:- start:2639 stop:4210 length:1572 start_codon:yes stop_codon:yes gene_type:complete